MNSIFRNTLLVGISEFASKGIATLSTILLVRTLGPESYGIYSLALSLSMYFLSFVHSGIYTIGIREIPRTPDLTKKYINNSITLKFFISTFSYIILILIVLSIDKPLETKTSILLAGLFLFLLIFHFDWAFRGLNRMEIPAIGSILQGTALLAMIYFFVKNSNDYRIAIIAFLISWLVSILFSNIIFAKLFGFAVPKYERKFSINFLKSALPISLSLFIIGLYANICIFMLSLFRGDYETGIFSAMLRIGILLLLPNSILQTAFFPELSRSAVYGNFNTLQKKYILLNFLIGAFVIIGIFGFAESVLAFLYGNKYVVGATILRLILFSNLIAYFSAILTFSALILDRQKDLLKVAIIGLIVSVTSNYILIQNFGAIGSAISSVSIEIAILTALIIMFKHSGFLTNLLVGIKPIILGIVVLLLSKIIANSINLYLGIASYIVLYPLFAFIARLVTLSEILEVVRQRNKPFTPLI